MWPLPRRADQRPLAVVALTLAVGVSTRRMPVCARPPVQAGVWPLSLRDTESTGLVRGGR